MQLKSFYLNGIKADSVVGRNDIVGTEIDNKMYFPIIPYGDEQEEIIGEGKSVIVRTLQVANGFGDAVIQIARLDSGGQIVFRNKFNLTSYNYVLLWQGFIYLPAGMGLYCNVDIMQGEQTDIGVGVYASTIIQDDITPNV